MSLDLATRMQQALGAAYVLERELGGGGMSRVFVAQDTALGRRVVVKVLPPDMAAGVSAERFRREIQLAAGLQHPHIVPVLSAGEADGMLYYTMPFVEGESLRGLLARRGELPVGEAVRLLREVAGALAYAHDRGLVHRDVKPENILLTTGHALVADFGIAKALSAAAAHGTLTSAGLALGTPAYMAPEQAAADPQTDHRADLYALGVLAYELLVGHPPFHGMAPQQIVAAHAVATPEPVSARRPAVPAPLAALVMRLLEKRPADRPQSAAEVVQALDAAAAASSGQGAAASGAAPARDDGAGGRGRRRAAIVAGALLLVVVLAAGLLLARRTPPETLDQSLIVVAPFRVSGDPSLAYLREGMLDLLAAKLTGEGGPRAGDPRTLLAAWQRRAAGAAGDLPERDAVALARALGAGQLLLGAVVGTPQRVSLRASLLAVPSGRVRATADVEGPTDSLGALVDRLAADLLARSAGEAERLAGTIATTPLPVLRLYLAGMADARRGRYPEAQQSFARALALDSTFVHAAVGLVTNNGNHPIDDSAAWAIVEREGHRLNDRDRAQVELRRRFLDGASYASQLEAGRRLVALAPDRAEGWDEVGGVLALFGGLTGEPDVLPRARAAFQRALELDPEFASPMRGLIWVAADLGDTATVRALWPRYERLAGGALEFETVRWKVAQSLGDSAAIAALRARIPSLPPRDLLRILEAMMVWGRGLDDAPAVLRALETSAVDEYDVERGGLAASSYLRNGGREEDVPARFRRPSSAQDRALEEIGDVLDALFWDGDSARARAALPRLDAILADARADAVGPVGQYAACASTMWHLTHGDTAAAHPPLRRWRELQTASVERREVAVDVCLLAAEALLAEARGDRSDTALGRLDALLAQGYEGVQFGNLLAARVHEANGDRRAALAAVRRRANHGRDGPIVLSSMLREEGRLAALTGDRERAIRAYRHFLALRPDPAPRLRADRDRVRAELARLEAAAR